MYETETFKLIEQDVKQMTIIDKIKKGILIKAKKAKQDFTNENLIMERINFHQADILVFHPIQCDKQFIEKLNKIKINNPHIMKQRLYASMNFESKLTHETIRALKRLTTKLKDLITDKLYHAELLTDTFELKRTSKHPDIIKLKDKLKLINIKIKYANQGINLIKHIHNIPKDYVLTL